MIKLSTVPYAYEPGLIARFLGVALEAVNPSTYLNPRVLPLIASTLYEPTGGKTLGFR